MLYENKCYNCPHRTKHITDEQMKQAKEFYAETGKSYTFGCGAQYNPKKFLRSSEVQCKDFRGAEICAHSCHKKENSRIFMALRHLFAD